MTPSLARHNPIVVEFFTIAAAILSSPFFLGENGRFVSTFCLVVRQPYDDGTNAYHQFYIPFLLCRIDIREHANIHKAISCKYLSNSICTVVEE